MCSVNLNGPVMSFLILNSLFYNLEISLMNCCWNGV